MNESRVKYDELIENLMRAWKEGRGEYEIAESFYDLTQDYLLSLNATELGNLECGYFPWSESDEAAKTEPQAETPAAFERAIRAVSESTGNAGMDSAASSSPERNQLSGMATSASADAGLCNRSANNGVDL